MVKKQRKMRSSLRSATKVQERGLQAKAERLADEPALIVPVCEGHLSHFGRVQRAVGKVWDARDSPKRLAWRARWGHDIARAYAATLLVAQSEQEKIIMLQVPTPFGNKVPVASRGKAKAAHLVGVQYFEDRKLRLFLVLDLAKKKGLHFYSLPQGGIACGGRSAVPPPDFVRAEAESLGLVKDPEGWGCAHAIHAAERFTLAWKSARVKLRKCGACAREGNTLFTITQHIAAKDVLDDFDVGVDLEPLPQQGNQPVAMPRTTPLDPSALEKYRKGELDDAGLLEAQRAARLAELKGQSGLLLVHQGINYGRDVDAFVASLHATPLEAAALQAALADHDAPIIAERSSPTKILAELWPTRGLAALEAVAGSASVARDVFEGYDVAKKGVGPALQQAQARGSKAATDSALPAYHRLPAAAAFADRVARAHRANGKVAALALAEEGGADSKLKGIAHAFELALGAGHGKVWKYSPLEQDLARQLESFAGALLQAEPAEYDAALRALARAAGVSEDLRRA